MFPLFIRKIIIIPFLPRLVLNRPRKKAFLSFTSFASKQVDVKLNFCSVSVIHQTVERKKGSAMNCLHFLLLSWDK